jgi:hypothetical protein
MKTKIKRKNYKSVNALVCHTTSKTFKKYWAELQRHERALRRIYANDRSHKHQPEETGSVNQVWPRERQIVSFYRCSVCMKDMTEKEVHDYYAP